MKVVGASEIGLASPEETGLTYRDNAELKARAAAASSPTASLVIADDAGFSIEQLAGIPGLSTARFAKMQGGYLEAATELIGRLPEGVRSCPCSAHYHCAVSFGQRTASGWVFLTSQSCISGSFSAKPRGSLGFGFDPWFTARDQNLSYGEMTAEQRDGVNHRAEACRNLAGLTRQAEGSGSELGA